MTQAQHIQPRVTAIVSVYNAEEFLRACLEDLVAQTIFERCEVIVIDADSPQNEKAIAQDFTQKYENITYFRTSEREGLYASWNRALRMAKGEYITNANADDRHAPDAFACLAAELDAHPEVALVYANCRITQNKNALFASAPITGYMRWLSYDRLNLLRRCEVGPQPMWRRAVHDKVGYFDESYVVTGDYDMWLRMAEHYPLRHIPKELGLYLSYDNNLETQDSSRTQAEYLRTQGRALTNFLQEEASESDAAQLQMHRHRLERYVENLESGYSIKNINKLSYHVFAYMLLSAKLRTSSTSMQDLQSSLMQMPKGADVVYLKKLLSV